MLFFTFQHVTVTARVRRMMIVIVLDIARVNRTLQVENVINARKAIGDFPIVNVSIWSKRRKYGF